MNTDFAISISIVPLVTAALLTPGYVILFIISRFTTGRPAFAAGLTVSSAYYVVVWSLCGWGSAIDVAHRIRDMDVGWLAAVVVVLVPVAIGIFVGHGIQKEWLYWLLRKVGLEPVHGIPSAWDWKFMRAQSQWITVHLKDGKEIVALYDSDCFTSTDPSERDLYLSNVCEYVEGQEEPVPDERIKGLLLKADSIDRIDFH